MPQIDKTTFDVLVLVWIALAILMFPVQLRITPPYGRHVKPGWGPSIPNRLGWMVMEIVSPVVFILLFLGGGTVKTVPMLVFSVLWVAHYAHRSLIFPLRARTAGKRIPLVIVAAAILFNAVNAGLNGLYLGDIAEPYPDTWLIDPRFFLGFALFVLGAAVNLSADYRLIGLRRPGGADYAVPQGGLFNFVSCPNHLGEIIEWTGFAVMCWNLPALSFAIWTAANLIPRALSHHRWYRQRFADYPARRKAVIPFIL